MPRLLTSIVLATVCFTALNGCSQQQNQELVSAKPKMVKSAPLVKFSGYIERHITGQIQAADTTSISFEVNGVVKNVYVNLGESFTKGSLLAELDPKVYQLAVNQRSSLVAEAKASRVEAKQNLERNLALKQQKLVSQAVIDNAQAAFDIANERVNSAISALNIDKKNLADTKLYAPYDGTISARLIEPSQQITTQVSAFTIQGNANLEIAAAISESIIGRVELGESVRVRIPALNNTLTYPAVLTEIGSQASIGNAFPITITFSNNNKQLMPGMSAEILLPIKENPYQSLQVSADDASPLYSIPLSSMATDSQGTYLYLLVKQGETFKTQRHYFDIVQTLPNALLARLDIKPNVKPEIITAGAEFLIDGQTVLPLSNTHTIYNQ